MPILLRGEFDAARPRTTARASWDAGQARWLLAVAAIHDGATRTEAAKIGGVTLQIVRDRVVKFNAQGPGGLIDRKRFQRFPVRCRQDDEFMHEEAAKKGGFAMTPSPFGDLTGPSRPAGGTALSGCAPSRRLKGRGASRPSGFDRSCAGKGKEPAREVKEE